LAPEKDLYFSPTYLSVRFQSITGLAKRKVFVSLSPYFKVPPELSKIVYQDPLERKKREREERIERERAEMLNR